ncbi:NAD(P)H-hydrate dehydratase [Acinetobacter indicus]|uniref:NAD(P)H-hydrate dehydratase n=1 Tax=Acinetobacter indicus TaxID=756892 RepID=UPI00209AA3B9|nr:NAD(P)H-hydrate dehydratase [Acinetobacter indicus]MCO8099514.1 NAD(P)H-hydrate dehydratase [Acinetobacter indicus]MCO8105118.1 NAD(P)H-hydrate dehydratase [Acinetobacter indicus]MCO8110792.1 NAD(P)H-hydrate dehydratase [Acinetobacter indicus]
MHPQVYHSRDIQAWEQRWFARQNSSYGLMQQVAWSIAQRVIPVLQQYDYQYVAVCCGQGNNAGDGYLLAKYLQQAGFQVHIYAAEPGPSPDLQQAEHEARVAGLDIQSGFQFQQAYEVYVDALFGIGLNRELSVEWQQIIHQMNQQRGLKVAIDIPSGLDANCGQPLPCAIQADLTYSVLGLKAGLFTGKGKAYAGQVEVIAAIPPDPELHAIAQLAPTQIQLPPRQAFGHKGSYGHVLVVGGHADMGGAVMMAAEAAFAAGCGKVTVVCDAKHHTAILSRAPNIMLRDINTLQDNAIEQLLQQVDAICFGMGLGRDDWAARQYALWLPKLLQAELERVLDADALWFLAAHPQQLPEGTYLTPHPGEAAKLLGLTTMAVEQNRLQAIHELQARYGGQWVLKGAGSLILEDQLWLCTAGNAGMGTGGMGDVLSGMIASLKAQYHTELSLHEIVTLHAQAGDVLAESGMRGLQAQQMNQAIYQVVNR